jgi:hypothetical protein
MIYNKNNKDLILRPNKFIPFSIVISAINMNKVRDKLLFPEDFKKNAAEDTLFQIKQHEKGFNFAYMANVTGNHNHNASIWDIIVKSGRELDGFSYILERMITNKYFRSIYLPYFFSFPLFLWISIILSFFISWIIWITALLLSVEFITLLPIFKFSIKPSIRFKTFLYCFLTEIGKLFYILKVIIKNPRKMFNIFAQLIAWEFKKIIYIYENRLKKPSPY